MNYNKSKTNPQKMKKDVTRRQMLVNIYKGFDMFSRNINFNVSGAKAFVSSFGAFVSILMLAMIAFYGASKAIACKEREDTFNTEYAVFSD